MAIYIQGIEQLASFCEQFDTMIDTNVTEVGITILNLSEANTRYVLRNLTLKLNDPGLGNTVTISLIKLVEDVETIVDSFVINQQNDDEYHELEDMFGEGSIYGDLIKITATSSAGAGNIGIVGQYSHASV